MIDQVSELYQKKLVSAGKAVRHIQSGWRVFVGSGCAEPQHLVRALCDMSSHLNDIELVHLLTLGIADYVNVKYVNRFRHNAFFIGSNVRQAVEMGHADYTPIFLSEIPALIKRGHRCCQVALLQLSPPDKHGYCSMGINVDIQLAAKESANLVIAEINPNMPRTFGATHIHLSEIDYLVEVCDPVLELPPTELDEVSMRIGLHVSRLIENGSCLQMGIGSIPDAVLSFLSDKHELGIHSEMFSDGILPLVENGNITNRYKKVHPGKIVTSFVMGSRKLYDFVDDNPNVAFYPADFTNDPRIICQNDRFVAVNSALQVDLTGQVCADSLGYRFYSGIGGQVDFIRGAAMSSSGKPILALPSTAKDGTISRIVPKLEEGAGVVTSRGDVHYVVTEWGIAYLHGKTIRERALELISIAHPDFRKELLDFTKDKHYVYQDEQIWRQAYSRYPVELEHKRKFGDYPLTIRPLKASDERPLQEFFYSHRRETVYNRYFSSKRFLNHREAAELVCVDYKQRMAIAAFDTTKCSERIIAIVRYELNPRRNLAESAIVVQEGFRRLGVASHLLEQLEGYAKGRGIEGFYSEILPINHAMLNYHRKLCHPLQYNKDTETFHMEYQFASDMN